MFPPLAYVAPLAWMNWSQGNGTKWKTVLKGQEHERKYNNNKEMQKLTFEESEDKFLFDKTKKHLMKEEKAMKEPALSLVAKQIKNFHCEALPNFLQLNELAKQKDTPFDPTDPKYKFAIDWRADDEFALFDGYTYFKHKSASDHIRSTCGIK